MSTKTMKVFAEVGDIVTGEVTILMADKNLVIVELETGERAVLPYGQLNDKDMSKQDRWDMLREPLGENEGTTVTVRVIDAYTDGKYRRRILVSERAVAERVFHQMVEPGVVESDAIPTNVVPEDVLVKARLYASQNRTIRGVIVGEAPGGKRVDVGGFIAVLSREDFCVKSADSLRKGTTVRVRIKEVSERGVTLTRKGVA